MQYEQITKEERVDLPRPSIDTGMGLERVAAVLQGQHDNYDIDLFRALIAASEEATGVKAEGDRRASHRVIADHLRSSAFLIADGFCRRTRAAVTFCAESCAAPCATRSCSARGIR